MTFVTFEEYKRILEPWISEYKRSDDITLLAMYQAHIEKVKEHERKAKESRRKVKNAN
jgi:hypothetical protein